jgi:hypothetical protein
MRNESYFVYLTVMFIIFSSGCLSGPEQKTVEKKNVTIGTNIVDLEKMAQNGDINELASALNDTDKNVRLEAAKLMGEKMAGKGQKMSLDEQIRIYGNIQDNHDDIGLTTSLNSLILALNDTDTLVRAQAAKSLGEIGDIKAGNSLLKALNDNNSQIRSEVVGAFGCIGIASVSERPLRQALKDPDPEVRKKAECALIDMKLEPYPVPNTGTYIKGEESTSNYEGWRFSLKNPGPKHGFIEIDGKVVFIRANDTCYIPCNGKDSAAYLTTGDKWDSDLKKFSENVARVQV